MGRFGEGFPVGGALTLTPADGVARTKAKHGLGQLRQERLRERGGQRERGREKSREGRRTEYLIQLDEYVKETIHNFTRKKCHNKAAEQSKRCQGTGYR